MPLLLTRPIPIRYGLALLQEVYGKQLPMAPTGHLPHRSCPHLEYQLSLLITPILRSCTSAQVTGMPAMLQVLEYTDQLTGANHGNHGTAEFLTILSEGSLCILTTT